MRLLDAKLKTRLDESIESLATDPRPRDAASWLEYRIANACVLVIKELFTALMTAK